MLTLNTSYLSHMEKQVKRQFIIDKKGHKVAVIITIHEYEGLLEDLHDLEVMVRRKADATVTFNAMRKKINTNK